MNYLLKANGDLTFGQRFPVCIEELDVRHESERIRHCNHAISNLDPVPCNASCLIVVRLPPQRLATRGMHSVAGMQYASSEVCKRQVTHVANLPQ